MNDCAIEYATKHNANITAAKKYPYALSKRTEKKSKNIPNKNAQSNPRPNNAQIIKSSTSKIPIKSKNKTELKEQNKYNFIVADNPPTKISTITFEKNENNANLFDILLNITNNDIFYHNTAKTTFLALFEHYGQIKNYLLNNDHTNSKDNNF